MVRLKLCVAAAALALLVGGTALAKGPVLKGTTTGNPKITAIDVISFAPDGILLIGDGRGGQIIAVETGDTTAKAPIKNAIDKIDEKLAGRLGTNPKGIEILSLAVNPASGVAYVAIRKQDDKSHVILTIEGSGKIGEFMLDNVKHARIALPAGEKSPVELITDVTWAEDQVLCAGRCNEEFASKIFAIPAPLNHEGQATIASAETYHVAHGKWETRAPMQAILPYEEAGKRYIVGAFTCTPLVKYPIDEIKAGAKVKGTSMVELGQGNQPRDMFVYEKDGKSYILVNAFRKFGKAFGSSQHWTARVELGLLSQNDKINQDAQWRIDKSMQPITDRINMVETFAGVVRMNRLDKDRALVLKEDGKGGLNLETLALP